MSDARLLGIHRMRQLARRTSRAGQLRLGAMRIRGIAEVTNARRGGLVEGLCS